MIKEILATVVVIGAVYGLIAFGFIMGEKVDKLMTTHMQEQLQTCKAELEDPHHCVSVCAEEFEKWGC